MVMHIGPKICVKMSHISYFITALQWASDGKRKCGRPGTKWRKTKETENEINTRMEIVRAGKDCRTGHGKMERLQQGLVCHRHEERCRSIFL